MCRGAEAWRGASLFNLLEFPKQFRKADGVEATKLPLYTNFRSGARILEAADVLIGELPAQQRPDPDKRLVDPNAGIDPLLAVAAAPLVSAAVAVVIGVPLIDRKSVV